MNPLIESCRMISKAGYEHKDHLPVAWNSRELLALGTYLLNESNLGHRFHLTIPRRTIGRSQDASVAIGFGGGIDSYLAILYALQNGLHPIVVHVNYGQPYYHQEKTVFHNLIAAWDGRGLQYTEVKLFRDEFDRISKYNLGAEWNHQEISLIPHDFDKSTMSWANYIVPARNLVLAAMCSEYSDTVWIVANRRRDETVGTPDKTTKFYKETSSIFTSFYGRKILVQSPFIQFSKKEVVNDFLAKGGNIDALKCTFSCYSPANGQHCGTCYACYKRFQLFQFFNTEYSFAVHPQQGSHFYEYQRQEQQKRNEN